MNHYLRSHINRNLEIYKDKAFVITGELENCSRDDLVELIKVLGG